MKYIVSFLVILCPFLIWANNLQISNVGQNQAAGEISFTISWDNSWRIDGLGTPNHWDAAWVFVKIRACGASASVPWTHGIVSTTVGNHSFGSLEPTLADGSAVGIDAAPNNTGVMLRRNATGLFPNAGTTNVTLRLDNFPATGDYEVKVIGVEMVYVPQGDYVAGGQGESQPLRINGAPFVVNSENAMTVAYLNTTTVNLPAAFPKGFEAFYCMKYEISQGQYATFLNTIDATGQSARFLASFNTNRNRINSGGTPPDIYFSDRTDRACNFLTWDDLLAYLDWAALRPITEMEYEKAARGQAPYLGGYAWGSTNITNVSQLGTPEDGTELALNANANASYSNTLLSGGDGGYGPVRVGIFATSSTTSREQTGASYYGIMELSGNLWEQCIPVNPDAATLAYDGQWGDGNLSGTGTADVANWPYTNCTGSCLRTLRGGSYADAATRLRISDRFYYTYTTATRNRSVGGRGAR